MSNKTTLKINKGQHRTLKVLVKPQASTLRVESLREQEYAVTPAIILVEGTLQGALAEAPELALASEFGKIPQAWNGRPVVVNHPRRNDQFVAAGQPDVWEQEVIGWVFNARIDDSKLKCELWTNKAWMEASGYTELKDNVESATTMEVSTGLFADIEQVEGIWNGENYSGIWRNVVPDHLAILTDSPGACSVADGCGTARTNQSVQPNQEQSMSKCKCNTPSTNSDNSDNPGEKKEGLFHQLLNLFSSFQPNAAGMSSNDQYSAATAALAKVEENFYMVAMYDDRVVYERYQEGRGWMMVQRGISFGADGAITISKDAVEVRPQTDFVPVNVVVNALGVNSDAPLSDNDNKITPVTDEPAAAAAVEETATSTSTENIENTGTTQTSDDALKEAETPAVVAEGNQEAYVELPDHTVPVTLQAFLEKGASADVSRINEALRVLDGRRSELVKQIIDAPKNAFSVQELNEMNVAQLEKVAAFAQKVDYSSNLGPQVHARDADDGTVVPLQAFPRKAS